MNDAKLHTDLSQDWDETRPSPLETEMLTCWDWDETKTYKNVSRQWRLWPSIGTVAAYSAKYSALVTYKILELFQYWSLSVDRHVTITAKFELWCSLMETLCNVNMGVPTNTNLLDDYAWCSNIFCIYFLLSASGTYGTNGIYVPLLKGYYIHELAHGSSLVFWITIIMWVNTMVAFWIWWAPNMDTYMYTHWHTYFVLYIFSSVSWTLCHYF